MQTPPPFLTIPPTSSIIMMNSLLYVSLATVASSALLVTPQDKINQHISQISQMNTTTATLTDKLEATTKGSLVYLDAGNSCDSKVVSGFGFTLGACVVRDNEGSGVIYSSCYKYGGQIKFTFTECDDEYCTKGCKSYQMAEDSCDTDPVEPYNGAVSCETNEDAFYNFDSLTLHTTRFYEEGDTTCSGQYGYWSSISMSCTSAYDRYCVSGGKHYSFNTRCEM